MLNETIITSEKNMLIKQGINTSIINKMSYKIESPAKWFSTEEFCKYCTNHSVAQIERLLLVSDGSLTRLLKTLFLSDVSFQVNNQEILPIDDEMANYLETTPNQTAISRDVWLGSNSHSKMVYAYSSILTSDINKQLYQEIVYKKNPLGILFSKYNLPVLRSKFFISQVKSEQIANDLGLDKDHPFWARIYRITAKNELTTAIFEVFSPEIVNTYKV